MIHQANPVSNPIPTHIITGFLGAGKTTTLNALLTQLRDEGESVLVVINEMGAVGIDAALLNHPRQAMLELSGGCMCCALRVLLETRLAAALRRWRPTRILIEPTGVGHPKDLLRILEHGPLAAALHSGPHTVVVDAHLHAQAALRYHPLYQEQWAVAQWAAIAKADLAGENADQRLRNDIQAAGLACTAGGLAATRQLLQMPPPQSQTTVQRPAPSAAYGPIMDDQQGHGYVAHFLQQGLQTVDPDSLLAALAQRLPQARCKGCIMVAGRPHFVQMVSGRVSRTEHAPGHSHPGVIAGLTVIIAKNSRNTEALAEIAEGFGLVLS